MTPVVDRVLTTLAIAVFIKNKDRVITLCGTLGAFSPLAKCWFGTGVGCPKYVSL